MPTYDYKCVANGQIIEVCHGMLEKMNSWGELCEKAGIDPGNTASDSPVEKLISGGYIATTKRSGGGDGPEAMGCSKSSCAGCTGCG